MVTVALRRVDLESTGGPDILEFIDGRRYLLLPNTSGAVDADEAIRLARLARAAGMPSWVKLEVTPEPRYLLPDPVETLRAAEVPVYEMSRAMATRRAAEREGVITAHAPTRRWGKKEDRLDSRSAGRRRPRIS